MFRSNFAENSSLSCRKYGSYPSFSSLLTFLSSSSKLLWLPFVKNIKKIIISYTFYHIHIVLINIKLFSYSMFLINIFINRQNVFFNHLHVSCFIHQAEPLNPHVLHFQFYFTLWTFTTDIGLKKREVLNKHKNL